MKSESPPHDPISPRERREQTLADVRATFSHPAGQRVLALLHAAAATSSPCFIPGKGGVYDTHAAAFRDGRRSVLLDIERWLRELEQGAEAVPGAVRPDR